MNGRRLLGVVLCGGASSRMGSDKSRLSLPDGTKFLDHAVARLSSCCEAVCVSGVPAGSMSFRSFEDAPPSIARKGSQRSPDPTTGSSGPSGSRRGPIGSRRGPIGGIVTALTIASHESFAACLFTPVDMPYLTEDDLKAMIQEWHNLPDQVVCGVGLEDRRVQPLVAIYPTALASTLAAVADSDDRSLLRWLERIDHQSVNLSPRSCHNINTPEDLSRGF